MIACVRYSCFGGGAIEIRTITCTTACACCVVLSCCTLQHPLSLVNKMGFNDYFRTGTLALLLSSMWMTCLRHAWGCPRTDIVCIHASGVNYILRLVELDRENTFRSSRGDVSVHTVPHVNDILGIDLDVLEGNSKHSVHFHSSKPVNRD